jgi:DNA modification methylase
MVAVFREVRRVLRGDGTLWLNLGDSYAGGGGYSPESPSNQPEAARARGAPGAQLSGARIKGTRTPAALKPKDLCGIPWRVAFALQADGWYLRSDIIWHKPNPMPESVTDRPTKAHEYLLLFAKNAKYFYDAEAIREKNTEGTITRAASPAASYSGTKSEGRTGKPVWQTEILTNGRNKRSVWTVTTKPYPGAHFAVFPPDLIEPCILAGTSNEGCCPECGAPWRRVVAKKREPTRPGLTNKYEGDGSHRRGDSGRDKRVCTTTETLGWKRSCKCGVEHGEPPYSPVPCTVLDPFMGSGTTAEVAKYNGRHAIGVELNAEYIEMGCFESAPPQVETTMGKPTTKLPDCPSCADNRAVYEEPIGWFCVNCQVAFDDSPDEGGDYSTSDPSWRMQREEERAKRKRQRVEAQSKLPPGFRFSGRVGG